MPLPGNNEDEPATADIDYSFDAFNDAEITDKAISTGLLDNDVHPAVACTCGQQESNTSTRVHGDESMIDNDVPTAQCDIPFDSASVTAVRGGMVHDSATGSRWGMQAPVAVLKRARPPTSDADLQGPSRGALKPGDRRECFSAAPPPLCTRNNNKQWWEC
eukprot:918293-Rhodomonas_salina.1